MLRLVICLSLGKSFSPRAMRVFVLGLNCLRYHKSSICLCAVLLVGDDILQLLRKEMSGAAGLKGDNRTGRKGIIANCTRIT